MEQKVVEVLEELDYQYSLAEKCMEIQMEYDDVKAEYVKDIEQNNYNVSYNSHTDSFHYRKIDSQYFEKSFFMIGLILGPILALIISISWEAHIALKVIGGIGTLIMASLFIKVISLVFNFIYLKTSSVKSMVAAENKERELKENKFNEEIQELNDKCHEELREYLEQITVPLDYICGYDYVKRMKDNIEAGRAKSIKEAILILEDYIQKEDLIEKHKESIEASHLSARASTEAASRTEEAIAKVAQEMNVNTKAIKKHGKIVQSSNNRLYDKLDEIATNSDPRWK
jgi:hypothetical protein